MNNWSDRVNKASRDIASLMIAIFTRRDFLHRYFMTAICFDKRCFVIAVIYVHHENEVEYFEITNLREQHDE